MLNRRTVLQATAAAPMVVCANGAKARTAFTTRPRLLPTLMDAGRGSSHAHPANRRPRPTSATHLGLDTRNEQSAQMNLLLEARHDLSPVEIDAIEDRIYNHNLRSTGRNDGSGLGFVIRDAAGRTIGVAAGYSWAGTSELVQMWVDEAHRGRGHARELLDAFVAEAASRGVRRIWVMSYDFQAPEMYEKAGFARVAEFAEWPEGHSNIVLCKVLEQR